MEYINSGVNIEEGSNLVNLIKHDVSSTHTKSVIGNFGGFAGMFKLGDSYKNPVLVSCTDGVGTKVSLAQEYKLFDGIGQDLVAMCINDLVTCGAKPLFFLDYYASSKLNIDDAATVIKSIANACKITDTALLGGETAEMPGHYTENNFDLAGFVVGCVEQENIIDNSRIKEGDMLIGIHSNGPHANGFSLIRKILKETGTDDRYLINELMKPTYLYSPLVLKLLEKHTINGIAHITGGGITENLPRIIPDGLAASVWKNSWKLPEIFQWIQEKGNITTEEMRTVFNCGIGMILVVNRCDCHKIKETIFNNGFSCLFIGRIVSNENKKILYS